MDDTGIPTTVHLHALDHPETLRLLDQLLGHRGDRERLGFAPTDTGAWVDWDRLASGPLSSTEVATVRIAHGCATIERAGGLPPALAGAVVQAVAGVASARHLLVAGPAVPERPRSVGRRTR
ncbi:MAG: hypothetical protein ACR2MO_10820 [Acidimicrobiales bacterium]